MKTALIALFLGVLSLILIYSVLNVHITKSSVDIHLYDTYYVLDYRYVFAFLLLYLGTLFSIGGLFGTQFKNKSFWILIVLFLLADAFYFLTIYKFIQSSR